MHNSTNTDKTHPYTLEQLKFFKKEIKEAGGVDELMFKKEALKTFRGTTMIAKYENIEAYKEKYLVGVYESLRPNFTTDVPYVFWSKLYTLLQRI